MKNLQSNSSKDYKFYAYFAFLIGGLSFALFFRDFNMAGGMILLAIPFYPYQQGTQWPMLAMKHKLTLLIQLTIGLVLFILQFVNFIE